MKKYLLKLPVIFGAAALISLALTCNNQNWVLFRAGQDYFPFESGDIWKYEITGMTKIVEIKNDTVINNISSRIIVSDFTNEYWQKNQTNIMKLSMRFVNYNGNDYPIQNTWLVQYQLPFILGNTWSDSFSDTVVVFGDIYFIKETVARQITAIENISVPVGSFFETYRIDFWTTLTINDSTQSYLGSEWYAPDVGLVKRVCNNIEQVLVEYSTK